MAYTFPIWTALLFLPGAVPDPERETPLVVAVRRAQPSVVAVRVTKFNARKEVVGAGVIVDARGYIVTCFHVVKGSKSVRVVLYDEVSLEAKIIREDPLHDLAFLKVETAKKVVPVRFATGPVFVGETVLTIGHPYGYVNTVSRGIVSGDKREVEMPTGEVLTGQIQTDAPISMGNSGGPLLNIRGEVIGVLSSMSRDGHSIAFALPSSDVQKLLEKYLPKE